MTQILWTVPGRSKTNSVTRKTAPKSGPCFAMAHGAGAPMDSDFMNEIAEGIARAGIAVARFEFPYMAKRREDGKKRGPDGQKKLLDCWRDVIAKLPQPVAIGGKSMGGRMASMIADETEVKGLVLLGYPFHPAGKPDKLRVEHLKTLQTPTLILQGERDTMGRREEVEGDGELPGYSLSPSIQLHWLPDGDHSWKPRKKSGHTEQQNWEAAVAATVAFLDACWS